MPVLSFTIDKMMYDLPWSAYSQYDSNLCIAGVSLNPQSNAATTTILGDAFINNFVTEIDFANSTLTFTQNAYFVSAGATVTPATVPTPVPVIEVVDAAAYRNATSGFAFSPYVGLPMQQISLNDSLIAGMAISLGTSPYFAITTSYCGNCAESFNPANSSTYNA